MSTTQCPKCGSGLTDDYGMATCPKCGTILFIDMDGVAHIGGDTPSRADEATATAVPIHTPGNNPPEAAAEANAFSPAFNTAVDLLPADSLEPGQPLPPLEMPAGDGGFQEPFEPHTIGPDADVFLSDPNAAVADDLASGRELEAPIDIGAASDGGDFAIVSESHADGGNGHETHDAALSSEGGADLNMDAFLGYQPQGGDPGGSPGEEPQDGGFGAPPGGPGDPLGINDYANSEVSSAKDGLLMFRILISGIDSKEMRESLREAMEDARFGWKPDELMSRISKGSLRIDGVSPVKATILINRIKRLPVQISWEQYAITQSEGS